MKEGFVDMLLLMTVEPGFGGQAFMEGVLDKVRHARELYPRIGIQVDGGIGLSTVKGVVKAGANISVAGSAIFGSSNPAHVIAGFREAG
ncbi:ribulose-phosphate 3-epimerase [Gracilaria domingensis]|nr:ribulose-phosphate 3-epimerase [Gracilaria domingensis]